VTLTGSRYTDASVVQFNGTTASFSVTDDSHISATVPAGATAGPITVTNASGTGTSASNFQPGVIYYGTGSGVATIAAVWYGTGSGVAKVAAVWVSDGGGGVKQVW
jgi:hypothetical protein